MHSDIVARVRAIEEDRTHGAGKIAEYGLLALKKAAELSMAVDADGFVDEMKATARAIADARPTMAALANLVGSAYATMAESGRSTVEELQSTAATAVDELLIEMRQSSGKTASAAAERLAPDSTILTVSYSRRCLDAIILAKEKGIRVIVAESRPRCEGRVMAGELARNSVPVTLCTDASVGHMMQSATVAWSGAAAVTENGTVVNRMGTALLALAASDCKVPYYALCQSYKFRPGKGEPVLEEKEGSDLGQKPQGVAVRNVYFDATPPRLVEGIFTEKGLIRPRGVKNLAARWQPCVDALWGDRA
jgi:translation initiation factor 2B subunit (eIF-2B alpha/beta/delta family)